MPVSEPRLIEAMREQLRRRGARLAHGTSHVGWKLGMGRRERIGHHVAVGHLTAETVLDDEDRYSVAAFGDGELHVDAELCVELRSDIEWPTNAEAARCVIGNCWAALEVVDLAPLAGEPDALVMNNIFHRAVAFGRLPIPLECAQHVTVDVNGERRDRALWPTDIPQRLVEAASLLAAVGQCMRTGDRVITGSITQVPVTVEDLVEADFGGHTRIALKIEQG